MNYRILAVDPGEKRIGLAISDLSGTIANPLTVIMHVARSEDAAKIAQIAVDNEVIEIVVGQPLDEDGTVGPQARKSIRMAEAIREHTDLPVFLWDEYGSTRAARSARIEMGANRKNRSGHLDSIAATVILQSYLDARDKSNSPV